MSIVNLILGGSNVTVSFLICFLYFIAKCDRSLLQNTSGFLLQNGTVTLNCDDFVTKCDSYYKMRRFLQTATAQYAMH